MFSVLNDSELEKISSAASKKKFGKGEIIFFETEPYLGFYVVTDGCVKIFKITGDGREHIIHFVYPYNTFAEVPLFEQYERIRDDDFTYPANSMSIDSDTEVVLIRAAPFYDILQKNHQISLKMLGALSKKLRHMNSFIESRMKSIGQRLAEFIMAQSKKSASGQTKRVSIEISKHDLASYLGTIDETLSRTFKKFQDEGIIEMKGRQIIIKDFRKLSGKIKEE